MYKLAFITTQAFSIINFRGSLIKEMVARGATVYAFAPDFNSATKKKVTELGAIPIDFSMSRVGMNPISDFINCIRLSVKLRSLQLDATFAYFIKPVIYGAIASFLAGIPFRFAMIEGAGYVFTEYAGFSFVRKILRLMVIFLYKIALYITNQVFMLNPDDKLLFVDKKMVSAYKVSLLNGIGVDIKYFGYVKPILKPFTFILIARLLREKGIYEYVEAAKCVKYNHPEIRFILVGNTDDNPGSILESEVVAWVSQGLIEWPGQVDDVRSWVAGSSVFVLPSYREGLPRSTQEAMAMGRAIITTNVPGCRETVEDGVNGFMVSSQEHLQLADAMQKFIKNPELAISMGLASRQIAEFKFNVDNINEQILQIIKLKMVGITNV